MPTNRTPLIPPLPGLVPAPDKIGTSSVRSRSSSRLASDGLAFLTELTSITESSSISVNHPRKRSVSGSLQEIADLLQAPPAPRHGSRSRVSLESFDFSGPKSSWFTASKCVPSEKLGSQREISDDQARFVYVNDPRKTNIPIKLIDNSIATSKYSVLTFLPRNLFEQFHRVAYVYFLVLIALNQIPQLGVFTPAASILPLAFVLGVTAVKDAYEDWRRQRSDRQENHRKAQILVDGKFRPKPWMDVEVGEIIKISANESVPCDAVLLSTSDPTGVAYVQTINLDGESNLKSRYAKQETLNISPETIAGVIRCEKPNRNIYGFLGNYDVDGSRKVSLGSSNIILRGCELKNTSWVVGVVVYTGMETKVMLNSSGAPSKRSRLEDRMNREVVFLAITLLVLCSLVTFLAGVWFGNHRHELNNLPYYRKTDYSGETVKTFKYYGIAGETIFTFLKSVILFQVMVPIALYISMEVVRLGQAFFMIKDKAMYDKKTSSAFQCRALNINEDLGQIKYVFSDKTGTLTENKMEFRCSSVGGVDYSGRSYDEDGVSAIINGEIWKPMVTVEKDPKLVSVLRGETAGGENAAARARNFFLALATCNTIVPIVSDGAESEVKSMEYQGESPDEQALAYAAAAYGFVLLERTSGHITVNVLGQRHRYDVLGLHEFDSDRKRMSVIIGCPDKTVKLFVKGADTSMFGVMAKNIDLDAIRETDGNLHTYSSLGLRTLVVAMRDLSTHDFEEWQSAYEKASTALFGRGSLLRAVASNIESNLLLLGASGIEDKLQGGVPEAIGSLRQAGIKVWVLTGDKQETAISVGYSCKLLTSEMTQIIINCNSRVSARRNLEDAISMSCKLAGISPMAQMSATGTTSAEIPLALIIDGTSLVYILETDLEEMLFEVATACEVVLCCRVAPLQKAGIVALIKTRTDDMTLAIGDGANDVSMIQMADVGIGISGQEGRQAVMSSDFAMGQFRFLVPLLLVHGHWNYQRMAYMILYNFYRNAIFVLILFWYVLCTAFSLTTAITEWSNVLYSVVYTALPTIVVGIVDKDLSRRTLLMQPQLYGSGQRDEKYNLNLFILTMTDAVWQSLVIFFIPYLAYRHSTIDDSSIGDLWILAVVIMVSIHLAIDVFLWNWITHASIWGCLVATVICIVIIDTIPTLPGYRAIFNVMETGTFWICLLAIIIAGMVPRFAAKAFLEYVMPSDIQVAREMEKFGNLHDNSEFPMSPIAVSYREF